MVFYTNQTLLLLQVMVTFRDIQLVLNKSPSACKASLGRAGSFDDVFTQFIWPLLSHPHQGRKGLLVGEKNKCIASLPKLECSFGPKIIFYYKVMYKNLKVRKKCFSNHITINYLKLNPRNNS